MTWGTQLSWFISGLTMVYGRYNELDNYGIHGLCKPTNISGVPVICSHQIICYVGYRWFS